MKPAGWLQSTHANLGISTSKYQRTQMCAADEGSIANRRDTVRNRHTRPERPEKADVSINVRLRVRLVTL